MGAEELHWGTPVSDIEDLLTIASHSHTMTTKLNHKNGDKTMHEDLLSNGGEKIGEISLDFYLIHKQLSCLGLRLLPHS